MLSFMFSDRLKRTEFTMRCFRTFSTVNLRFFQCATCLGIFFFSKNRKMTSPAIVYVLFGQGRFQKLRPVIASSIYPAVCWKKLYFLNRLNCFSGLPSDQSVLQQSLRDESTCHTRRTHQQLLPCGLSLAEEFRAATRRFLLRNKLNRPNEFL